MVLVIDTATENTFLGLWKDGWISQETFPGGRDLNSLILWKLDILFSNSAELENRSVSYEDLTGIIVNAGPGSFTGLRIGLSVGNTIVYTQDIPIVGVKETENVDELTQKGLDMLKSAGSVFETAVLPHYGAEPHITKPKSQ